MYLIFVCVGVCMFVRMDRKDLQKNNNNNKSHINVLIAVCIHCCWQAGSPAHLMRFLCGISARIPGSTSEPMQVILFNRKTSTVCMGFHFFAPWKALPHKTPLLMGFHVWLIVSCPPHFSGHLSSAFAVVAGSFFSPAAVTLCYTHS